MTIESDAVKLVAGIDAALYASIVLMVIAGVISWMRGHEERAAKH
jgi:hypothetical protein